MFQKYYCGGGDAAVASFERLPPHAIEAEMCVLGSLMLDPKRLSEVRLTLSRESFYQPDHQLIFSAICRLSDLGHAIDGMTVREELVRQEVLMECGGVAYLAEILNTVPSACHVDTYAARVRECATKRGIIEAANAMLRDAYGPANQDNSESIAGAAMAKLASLLQTGRGADAEKVDSVLGRVYEEMQRGGSLFVKTGFGDLDRVIGGLMPGEMWLVGARPSMGKSTWVRQAAVRAARSGVPTAIVSLEEGKSKIGRNLLSAECEIDNRKIRRPGKLGEDGALTEAQWAEAADGIARLGQLPLWLIERARTLRDIRAEAAVLVQKHGVRLIIVDYLQRVQAGGKDKYERAGNASEGLSDLFKELGICGLVPVQLNRGNEARDDKRPCMSDLRDSGQIEQDADGILFLHREDYYHSDERGYEPTNVAELYIGKNRDGVRGFAVKLKSQLRFQRFEDMQAGEEPLPF